MISKLLKNKNITKVISVSRKPLNLQSSKLEEVIVPDFSHLLNHINELCGDIYFCALGTTKKDAGSEEKFRKIDYDAIVNFGKIAKNYHAKSLCVISASMADEKSAVFYNRVKGETEKALINLELNRLVLFRPGLLIGDRAQKRTGEEFALKFIKAVSPILPSAIEKRIATDIETLTRAMLREGQNLISEIKIIEAKDI